MRNSVSRFTLSSILLLIPACSAETPSGIPVLGNGRHTSDAVEITTIIGEGELREPTDIAFRPDAPNNELWITNRATFSMTIVRSPGTAEQMSTRHNALGNTHFMPKPSALAFGAPGFMATIHEIDEPTQASTPADFMGPTLWPSDPTLFTGGHGSHLDMLHNTPNGVGIAWERDNVYWIVDGYHRSITRYDFALDHGPGQEDHSDGIIARCVEGMISYVPGVSAHAELDHETGLLYVADPGSGRVFALDTTSGTRGAELFPNYDGGEMYSVDNATLMTVIEGSEVGLVQPSGLAIHDDMIVVSDAASSVIAAFDLETYELLDWISIADVAAPGSLRGIDFDAEGRLYVADVSGSRVLRIAPKTP
jgi:sugar lactone lactonase YvrE